MNARAFAAAGIVGLFVLALAWHAWFAPPQHLPAWLAAGLHALPITPALVLLARGRRSAGFWGALAALVLFCHGISEAWSSPATRVLAAAEIVLSVLVIFAASWDGLRARFAKRRGGQTPPL